MDGEVEKTYRKGAATSEICDLLRTRILTLEMRPGMPLDETTLSQEFNVSRSPVREALNRLSAERLVVTSANRGSVVAPIDLQLFPRFIEALDLQQRYATRLAARRRTDADVDRLRGLADAYNYGVKHLKPISILQANYEFHVAVGEAGRNPYVIRHYRDLLSEARRFLHIHIEYLIDVEDLVLLDDQHFDFVDAIEARDVELADQVAHAHSLQFQNRFLKAMRHMPDPNFRIEPVRKRGLR